MYKSDSINNGNSVSGSLKSLLSMNVIVAAPGYFVDMYDLLLFGIERVPSLMAIGVSGEYLVIKAVHLHLFLSMQF